MPEIIKLVTLYTLKYFAVLIGGFAAGYINCFIANFLIDRIKKYEMGPKNEFNEGTGDNEAGGKSYNGKVHDMDMILIFATIISFLILFIKYGLTSDFGFYSYLMSVLIIMFFTDLKTKTIPNELVVAGLLGSIGVFIYNIFVPMEMYAGAGSGWWQPLLGVLPGSGILFLISVLGTLIFKNNNVMGMGDVKIFAPIGIFLGWKMCILALIISMFLGGITSLLLIVLKKMNRKDTIPFGPFIAVATFIVIVYGEKIWNWYFSKLV